MFYQLEVFLSGHYIVTSSVSRMLLLVFMTAVSESLGYSAVLYINRVAPKRFIPSVLVNILLYSFGILFWVFSIWIISRFMFLTDVSIVHLFKAIALAYFPQLLSFLVFIPFFGNTIRFGLNLFSFLLLILFVQHCIQLLFWQTVVCVLIGFLVRELLQHKITNPVTRFASNLRNLAAGKEIHVTKHGLEPYVSSQSKMLDLTMLNNNRFLTTVAQELEGKEI